MKGYVKELYFYFINGKKIMEDRLLSKTIKDLVYFLPYIKNKSLRYDICKCEMELFITSYYQNSKAQLYSRILNEICAIIFDIKVRVIVWSRFIKNYFRRS
jgi:hypothetical protein